MFTSFTKVIALTATALTFGSASVALANDMASTSSQFESYEIAQTVGMDRRQDRREDRLYDRQDCRQTEGVGADKRNCKQAERQERNMNG